MELQGSAKQLELAAAEMAQAAAALVEIEQRIENEVASSDVIPPALETVRQEAAASLERKMATMEAVVVARRKHGTAADVPRPALETEEEKVKKQLQPPPQVSTGPAAGDGYEIILQVCPFAWTHGPCSLWTRSVKLFGSVKSECVAYGLMACFLHTGLPSGYVACPEGGGGEGL